MGPGATTVTATSGVTRAAATVQVVLDRSALVSFYNATGGPDWVSRAGWLSDAPLDEWHGVSVRGMGDQARVTALRLSSNRLEGSIPAEIGDLRELRSLILSRNRLTGSIPSEIAYTQVSILDLSSNQLSGPVPPDLGSDAGFSRIWLQHNQLSGSIPSGLVRMGHMREFRLHDNALSGEIPADTYLPRVEGLWLGDNGLTGSLPAALPRFHYLRELVLMNSDLSGPLPAGMIHLDDLSQLIAGGSGLCAPESDEFQRWLERIPKRRIASCGGRREGSDAYLTQAVQSRAFPVPLVAGEDALLRVFVVAPAAAGDTIPLVRATFHVDGQEVKVVDIERGSSIIGTEVEEGSLDSSANALIPASVIRPGLEMVVEIDPDETMDPKLGVAQRIPATGRTAVDVRTMLDLELTLIPFLWKENPDSSVLEIVADLSVEDELLLPIRNLLPVAGIELVKHDPVVTTTNDAFKIHEQTHLMRATEGGSGYWMGTMSGRVLRAAGVAYVSGWTSFSVPVHTIMVHELGHNLSLLHAPCRAREHLDETFPDPGGRIGAWGYDVETNSLVGPKIPDLMSYCGPQWISDYHFSNALRHRISLKAMARQGAIAPGQVSVDLGWGRPEWRSPPGAGIRHRGTGLPAGRTRRLPACRRRRGGGRTLCAELRHSRDRRR